MTDEARLAAWHRNVYESYDEEEGCPECGGPLTVDRDPDGGEVYCKTCLECPNCGGPAEMERAERLRLQALIDAWAIEVSATPYFKGEACYWDAHVALLAAATKEDDR